MTLDLRLMERRMRRAYERGRVKRASWLILPWLAVLAVGLWFGPFGIFDYVLGTSLATTGFVYLWRGQLAEQSLVPGVLAGVIPLGLALLANGPNPHCTHGNGGVSMCTLACAVGGVIAVLRISQFARKSERAPMAFGLAVIPAFLLGSIGCGCIGYTGVMAMAGAMFLTSIPDMLRWAARSA